MAFTLCTWNINSFRLRAGLVADLIKRESPDVICLQEAKSPLDKMPFGAFEALGYPHWVARGQKGYNGVVILSKLPLEDAGDITFCGKEEARHVAAKLPSGIIVHNYYVPAGGDKPDVEANPKFAHKLQFLDEMTARFKASKPSGQILVGDLNIAPREDDVWDHKKLLKVVSHTPIEVEKLTGAQAAGGWIDTTRADIPEGNLYSWWSYRSPNWDAADKGRRLDHVWASSDLAGKTHSSRILRDVRGWEQPSDHAPVFVTVE